MEYSMLDIATIASNIPPYSKSIVNGTTGLLVEETSKAWTDAINYLIGNRGPRQYLARSAKESVLKEHNINTKAYLWKEAYEKLLKPSEVVA
jgi:glycosyltransferase involved in cell wall biosynthesis